MTIFDYVHVELNDPFRYSNPEDETLLQFECVRHFKMNKEQKEKEISSQ